MAQAGSLLPGRGRGASGRLGAESRRLVSFLPARVLWGGLKGGGGRAVPRLPRLRGRGRSPSPCCVWIPHLSLGFISLFLGVSNSELLCFPPSLDFIMKMGLQPGTLLFRLMN